MKQGYYFFIITVLISLQGCQHWEKPKEYEKLNIDRGSLSETITDSIIIDSVWAGHPVDFCLLTHQDMQYIAYYNHERSMVVGQRNLADSSFTLYTLPVEYEDQKEGTSTVLGWDSHNYVTMAVDKAGYIHLAGNMHVNPLTYFRSKRRFDISTLDQVFEMVGTEEEKCTYPKFMTTKEGELIFQYRDGGSGNGNEIYNQYSVDSRHWKRLLDTPLTHGEGKMNAYLSQPQLLEDDWYHVYWVWRDTPDCSTNHDLSYMKSPNLKDWYDVLGKPVELPATIKQKSLIVAPIPPGGGIINLAAKLCLDGDYNPIFVYQKYDSIGNLQLFVSQLRYNRWVSHQITNWDYRWEFSGNGTVTFEVEINDFIRRLDGYYEVSYNHVKYGSGTFLLDNELQNRGEIKRAGMANSAFKLKGSYPGLEIKTLADIGQSPDKNFRYLLKWETLPENRDQPRPEPWPEPSDLVLYKVKLP